MWKKDKYHHQKKVSSFNPAWCLLPPPTRVAAVTPRNNNSHQKSVVASAFHAKKALVQYRQSQKVEIKEEPTSPRVGCMGQIRRCKTTSRSAIAAVVPMSRSWSAVTPPAPPAASVVPRLENMMKLKGLSLMRVVESVEGMDPPRPVEKKEVKEENLISLWKRRCCEGGRGEGLQLELRRQMQQQIC